MGHPHLNSNSIHTAKALLNAGALRQFHTSLNTTRLALVARGTRLGSELSKRALPPDLSKVTVSHPASELKRLARRKLRIRTSGKYEPDATALEIDRAVASALRDSDAGVYAFEDSALASFGRAAEFHQQRIYDLPIGYWKAAEEIFEHESVLHPDWASTLIGKHIHNQKERLARKDEELSLATRVMVASSFTKRTLENFPGPLPPVSVIPYGAPPPPVKEFERTSESNEKLRVLFVGALSQRKGLSYLFDAIRPLAKYVELTLIGRPVGNPEPVMTAINRAQACWIESLPHDAILEQMQRHDVFVFPSLFEGFGLVLTEALSRGLPIISTPHTAAPDLIENGNEGWVVPIRDAGAISHCLEQLVEDRGLLESMSAAAVSNAQGRQWTTFEAAVTQAIVGAHE